MRKALVAILVLGLVITLSPQVMAKGGEKADCTTIQDGFLTYLPGHYLEGEPLQTGFDPYGYNYQAHKFSGSYANSYLGKDGFPPWEGDDDAYLGENPGAETKWYWPYRDVELIMKWSDEWISNMDCNADGKLDRGYSCDPVNAGNSGCPGAWLTNHQKGSYELDDKKCNWTYFTKIVTPNEEAGAYKDDGLWYTAEGTEIGPVIWGAFATIQVVENDKCADIHGAQYVSPASPGLGKYNP